MHSPVSPLPFRVTGENNSRKIISNDQSTTVDSAVSLYSWSFQAHSFQYTNIELYIVYLWADLTGGWSRCQRLFVNTNNSKSGIRTEQRMEPAGELPTDFLNPGLLKVVKDSWILSRFPAKRAVALAFDRPHPDSIRDRITIDDLTARDDTKTTV